MHISGKTTLLNLLSRREKNHRGTVLYNGQIPTPALERQTAYVPQTDLFYPELTVREHLLYQARLRMNPELEDNDRELAVTRVLNQLGLNPGKIALIALIALITLITCILIFLKL